MQDAGDPAPRLPRVRSRRKLGLAAGAVALACAGLAALVISGRGGDWPLLGRDRGAASIAATFVGTETCADCHEAEAGQWRGSQHRRAMDHATERTVLGDFSDAIFEQYGVRSRFFRDGGKFLVDTDGPDGRLATFEVKYTFGVEPLQQYLIEFPDGRLQALSIAWDSRPAADGGQRWFHLYPDERIDHHDVLHWTKLNQNWNFMCSECHSTGVRRSYDAASDSFATTWAEISVGCETCHGEGSRHVAWAQKHQSWWPFGKSDDPAKGLLVLFDERRDIAWTTDPETGTVRRSAPAATLRKEVETCGLCHALRSGFSEDWKPGRWLSETHVVSPLVEGMFHADGQMLGEVYNYAPFKQSQMYAAGVTCSDCHDPHSAKPLFSGNDTCLQCHASEKYESADHHHHEDVAPTPGCPSCHMPERTYMVVDPRHDHGFRVPRPDLTVTLGTPNACNDCHDEKTAAWAAAAIEQWFGATPEGFQTYARAFHAAWNDQAEAGALLAAVADTPDVPSIARASAFGALAPRLAAASIDLARTGLRDRDPMVRIGALDMIESLNRQLRLALSAPLLVDPVRGVRIRAAAVLADVPQSELSGTDRKRFERAAAELVAFHEASADRPASRSALGVFYAQQGRVAEAEAEYLAALRLSPGYAPAAVNLADHYGGLGADGRAERVLREAITIARGDAGLHHALGLVLARFQRYEEALVEFRQAAELEPRNARYAYVHAIALYSTGNSSRAIELLKDAVAQHPGNIDILMALVSYSQASGNFASALQYANQLLQIAPNDAQVKSLVDELRGKTP